MGNKKYVSAILLTLVAILIFYNYKKYKIAPDITNNNIEFIDAQNNSYTLNTFNDKNSIVVFGAGWCRDCRAEVPALENLKAVLGEESFHFIALTDDNFTKIAAFQQSTGSTYNFFTLNKSLKENGIFSIPTVYVLNRNGEIVLNHVGNYHWDNPSVIEKIKKAVKL